MHSRLRSENFCRSVNRRRIMAGRRTAPKKSLCPSCWWAKTRIAHPETSARRVSWARATISAAYLWVLEPHVLIGGERAHGDRGDRVLGQARPHPHQRAQVHDRREHHAVDRELLDAVQQGLALGDVALPRLLLEQLVDVRIPPVGVAALGVDELRHAAGRVARVAHGGERSEERRVGKEGRSRWSPYH